MHFPPHMRQYIYGNKKQFWRTLLLCCLVAAFLTPVVHSHDHRHDDGEIRYDLNFNLKADVPYNPIVHSAGEWLGENLFAHGENNVDYFSRHDHSDNQHVHALESLTLRAERCCGGLATLNSFFIQTANNHLPPKEVSYTNYPQTSPVTHPFNLEFIFIATDLPPPIV